MPSGAMTIVALPAARDQYPFVAGLHARILRPGGDQLSPAKALPCG